ncbi:MAG: transglutaminase domain-containing protein [Chloroflexi bacterium]|nr:transglutaminase domain-containing protein [Chloroflexota bacterium]
MAGVVIVNGSVMNGSAPHSSEREVSKSTRRGLFLLFLLWVALVSVAFGLAEAVRDIDVLLILAMLTAGALTGWVLAASRLPDWLVGIVICVLGVVVVLTRVGRLDRYLATMFKGLLALYWDIWRWLLRGSPPDWSPFFLALIELRVGVETLFARWSDWLGALTSGNAVFDPVAVALVWGGAAWIVAAWAGWKVRRHQPLPALVPAIALLVATLKYVRASSLSLLLPLGVTLLLMPLVRHDAREHRWRVSEIKFSRDIWRDLALQAALLSLMLMIAATWGSSISMQQIIKFRGRSSEEQQSGGSAVAESLGMEQRSAPAEESIFDTARIGWLPRRHLIGTGPELSGRVMLVITTSDSPSDSPPHYYWQSITYDRYFSYGWFTGKTSVTEYDAGQAVISTTVPFHRVVRQEVDIRGNVEGLVHVAGTLLAVDRDYSVAWRPPSDAFGAMIDTRRANVYRADSLVPVVSEDQLLAAGSDYPEWIESRYLFLPDTVPLRVLSLARDLTATEPTPYDRARAIETYLRTFSYNLDVPMPPQNRDVVDYFLFDLQEGYCDYFASAMVVLARAAGLPARLAVGYASGAYDAENARYIVTADQAHAWVQVYFPGYGWIEFEPTSSHPLVNRPAKMVPIEWSEPEGMLEPVGTGWGASSWLWGRGILAGLVLLVLGGMGWTEIDNWRLRHQEPTITVATLYGRLWHYGRWMAVPIQSGDTPYEFVLSLKGWMADRAQDMRRGGAVSSAIQDAQLLVSLYVWASYSPRTLDGSDRMRAVQAWWRLRRWLWLSWGGRTRIGRIFGFWSK